MLCGVVGFAGGPAQADVTTVRSTAVAGVGAMALGNMTGTSTTVISGDRMRTQTDVKMQSKLMGFLARNAVGPTAEIVLLDQDRILRVNINKKEYTETTFEQMRAQLQQVKDQVGQSQEDRQQPSAVDQSKCVWLPAKVSVSRTGERAQYAGFDSERAIITAAQPCQDKDTGSICEVALILDQWLSPDFTEGAEVRGFYTNYAARMGMDAAGMQDASQKAKAMFSQYKGIWEQVAVKMQDLKGYPVRTAFTLAMGGPQCKDPKAQQARSGESDDGAGTPGGLAGAVAGRLGGLFHKKSDPDPAAAQPAATATAAPVPPGDVPLMTVSSQLLSVSTDAAAADAFTVPADFKKQELKTQ
jgi:hypothetical protein